MKKCLSFLGGFFSRFYMAVVFIFLYAPIVLLMVFSFNDSKSTSQFTAGMPSFFRTHRSWTHCTTRFW